MPPFEHPGYIPIPIALAIGRIACNRATPDDWELLDTIPRQTCLEYVEAIWKANDWDRVDDNVEWFARELAKADN